MCTLHTCPGTETEDIFDLGSIPAPGGAAGDTGGASASKGRKARKRGRDEEGQDDNAGQSLDDADSDKNAVLKALFNGSVGVQGM
jgi:hypothetical protein